MLSWVSPFNRTICKYSFVTVVPRGGRASDVNPRAVSSKAPLLGGAGGGPKSPRRPFRVGGRPVVPRSLLWAPLTRGLPSPPLPAPPHRCQLAGWRERRAAPGSWRLDPHPAAPERETTPGGTLPVRAGREGGVLLH